MLPYRTLLEALADAPAEKPFVVSWDEEPRSTFTFGQFQEWATAQSRLFRDHGVRPGDRVVLILPQGVELMAAFVGAMMLGAIPAILAYPNFKVEPAKYRFGLAGVTRNLGARLGVIDRNFPADLLDYVALPGGAELVRALANPGGSRGGFELPDCGPECVAFVQHSAGTTGLQKGVALTHAAVLRQLGHLSEALALSPSDAIYSWLPLYHDMGLIAAFMLPMTRHLPVVMQSPTAWVMDPATMLQAISEYRCTLAWIPNFTYQFVARRTRPDELGGIDLSSLRALINCSEPVRAESMEEFAAAFGACGFRREALQSSYAMAENVFAVTHSGVAGRGAPVKVSVDAACWRREHRAVPVAAGHADSIDVVSSGACLPGNEVRIVSSSGKELPEGHVGEILIRSDSLFDGYYNRPDLTAQALRDGWYWSGDLGFLLHGELFVTGRRKDLIIIAGKNIYPQDVEEIVSSHAAIHDGRAVAFGLYNPDLGTQDLVVAAEVNEVRDLSNSAAIEQTVRTAVVGELGVSLRALYLKPPKWIVKSTAGKPARSTTREKLLAEHPELAGSESREAQI
jgi:acyl-CoA synthetase (AMP-forming)/AMP-acid ligase II